MMVALVAVAAFALQTSFRALNDATATATAEDWNITAGAYSLLGNAEQSLAGQTAQVNIDGNNVTLSVTVSSISVSLTGTKSGSTVTFTKGQPVMGQYYLVGSNTAQTTVSDIVFAYDETAQKLTQTTERIVVSQSSSAITSPMGYIKGVVLENPNGGTGETGVVAIDFSGPDDDWGIGTTKLYDENSFTYGDYTIKLKGTSGGGYRWYNTGNIILGKKDAYLELPAFDFDVAKIEVVGTSQASAAVVQNIYVGDVAVSTATTGMLNVTQSYTISPNYQAAGNVYRIVVTSAHNTQITKVLIYPSTGEPPVPTMDYYVVGDMTGWGPDANYKMTRNTAADTEEYMLTMNLTTTSQFKVCKSDGQTISDDNWFPSGMGNNYGENGEITADGEYTIYFRPNGDGGSDWFYNYIYAAATPINTIAEAQAAQAGTTMTVEGTVVASAANGAVLYDGTDYINALELYHKVRMKGALGAYGGANQFTNSATVTDLGVVDYTDPDPVLLDGAGLNAIAAAGTVTRQFVALKGHLTISGNYYNVTVEGAEGVQASLVKPKEDLTSLNDKDVVIYGYAMYMTGNTNKYVYIVATIVGEPDVLEPVVWPEGVEGEQWKITTTATQTGGATQNIVGEPCQVAYLVDAAEAYLQAPFTLQGRQFVVTLKGSVDDDLNVTIPLGQLVAQDEQTGMNAFIFAKNADQEFTDVVLTYSKTAEKQSLKYEGSIYLYLTPDPGSTDVPVFTLTNTEVFKEVIYDYYVVGNMNDWAPNENFKMTKNTEAEGVEEYMFTMNLTTENQFKVVRVKNGNIQNWYPSGIDNNYGQNGEITADGEYTIYFRPNGDGGDDWFYNFIYVAASAEPLPELPGDVIWSSNTPVVLPANWDGEVAPRVAADKFADANAGDVLHIAVQDVTAGSAWSAQVAPFAQNWTQIENGFPVGTGDISDAYFTVTGDMLRLLKANGLIIFGAGYSTRLATLERNVYPGSEYSIWLGDKTLTWTQASVDKLHLINAGVEAGMTLKLIYEATGNPNIQLVYGWGAGENYGQVTYGDGFATLEITEDMLENLTTKGVIVNADGIRLKQIELLPAEEPVPENFYFIGDSQDWNLADMPAFTKDETTGNFTYEVTVEQDFYFALSDVASVETPGADGTEEQWNNTWADFNETHRYAAAAGEAVQIVEGQPMQLIKCPGTLVIKDLGIYTITVTPEMEISITKTGEVTPQTDMIYLLGTPNDWNRENPTEMNFDETTGNYYFEVETDAAFYFAITDKVLTADEATADADWSDYNANHRWAIAEGDVNATLDEEVQLQKVNGTIVLQPGSYTIIITPELKMIVTGEGTQLTPDYYVVGESTQLGLEWGVVEANKMELLPARTSQDEIYVKKYEAVEFAEGDVIKFKVGASTNGTDITTWYPEGMGNESEVEIEIAGTYDVIFTFNATQSTPEIPVMDVELRSVDNPLLAGEFIYWLEEDVCSAGDAESLYGLEDFYMTCVDTDGKQSVDANTAYFGDADHQLKFTHRFKSGGKSGAKNSLTLTIPSDGKLSVYARTASNGATDRNLVLTQGETELYNAVVQEADAIEVAPEDLNAVGPAKAEGDPVKVYPIITVDVVAGEVAVGYPTGSLNFYAFQFVSGTTGIVNIMPEQKPIFDESLPAYNLQGQRVTKSYRGIVIQNGRKFMNK